MPAKSPLPTPGKGLEDDSLARARTKTPAFTTMASIRKSWITPSPEGTTATEDMTPFTMSPEPPDSISFRPSSVDAVPDDVRESLDDDDDGMGTPSHTEWRARALFFGDKSNGKAHRRACSYQDSDQSIPPLPQRSSLGAPSAESESSMPSASVRKSSRRRKSRSYQSRSSNSMDFGDWTNDCGMSERRRSSSTNLPNVVSPDVKNPTVETPTTSSSSEGSPDVSPTRLKRKPSSRVTSPVPEVDMTDIKACLTCGLVRLRTNRLVFILFLVGFLSLAFNVVTNRAVIKVEDIVVKDDVEEVVTRFTPNLRSKNPPAGGLRGSLVNKVSRNRPDKKKGDHGKKPENRIEEKFTKNKDDKKDPAKEKKTEDVKKISDEKVDKLIAKQSDETKTNVKQNNAISARNKLTVAIPTKKMKIKQAFNSVDQKLFDADAKSTTKSARVLYLHDSIIEKSGPISRRIPLYPSDFTDNTQLYGVLDSDDGRLSRMERRDPYSDEHCVPMQEWQTTFHPSCNGMHEMALDHLGSDVDNDFHLFGTKGFWRNAWKVDILGDHHRSEDRETVVLKTLKFEHKFEDAHFEHDRIDAVAMERLTSSPHVINVFGFCGHSVITEYAEGTRLGSLADKSKKIPLARLKIARDIANGLADVHGIDGDGNATFVHLDINPANVVSIGGTLKLNDFNIGIIRRWNVTSQQPCGFPAQYPNPQWRSPEEARNEQNLTEKVDIFSLGHIFFRLICGHEPWNKLEPEGQLIKEIVNEKVKKGVLPTIPEEVMNSTDEEVIAIRDAMLKCYAVDPSKRPSAREIADTFQSTLDRLSA